MKKVMKVIKPQVPSLGAVDRNGQRIPMSVAAGDKVLIPQFGGSTVKVGEEEYHLFRDSEILAKINE